jgi:hypothetical protein
MKLPTKGKHICSYCKISEVPKSELKYHGLLCVVHLETKQFDSPAVHLNGNPVRIITMAPAILMEVLMILIILCRKLQCLEQALFLTVLLSQTIPSFIVSL